MTTVALSLCLSCRHLRDDSRCAAFPEGIPDRIIASGADHRTRWPGDHGIQYAMRPGDEDLLAVWQRFHALRAE